MSYCTIPQDDGYVITVFHYFMSQQVFLCGADAGGCGVSEVCPRAVRNARFHAGNAHKKMHAIRVK